MPQSLAQLKRKLRDLKQQEITIRFKNLPVSEHRGLIWSAYFSTQHLQDATVKFSLAALQQKSHEELRGIFEEYFYQIYFRHFRECGLSITDLYDPGLLALLGLPPYAGMEDIKQRYRFLAKKYHPDLGGDHDKFIELADLYDRVTRQA